MLLHSFFFTCALKALRALSGEVINVVETKTKDGQQVCVEDGF